MSHDEKQVHVPAIFVALVIAFLIAVPSVFVMGILTGLGGGSILQGLERESLRQEVSEIAFTCREMSDTVRFNLRVKRPRGVASPQTVKSNGK